MLRDILVASLADMGLHSVITNHVERSVSKGAILPCPKHLFVDLTTKAIEESMAGVGDAIEKYTRLSGGASSSTELVMGTLVMMYTGQLLLSASDHLKEAAAIEILLRGLRDGSSAP